MKPVPRIRLVQSWQTYSKGQFLWPDSAMLRNWLIGTGRAVLDEPAAPAVNVATAAPAEHAGRRKKKVMA